MHDSFSRHLHSKAVTSFRDHPATLMWYLNDELGPALVPILESHQQLVQGLDYNHPTWSVLYEAPQIYDYANTCDTIGTDPYPIPTRNVQKRPFCPPPCSSLRRQLTYYNCKETKQVYNGIPDETMADSKFASHVAC